MKIRHLLFAIILSGTVGWGPLSFSFLTDLFEAKPKVQGLTVGSQMWMNEQLKSLNAQAGNLDPKVLELSLNAYIKARRAGLDHKGLLTIIDYSKPSTERRLWVVDLNKGKVLFNTWVSHGKNSGSILPTSFSNQLGSLKSSIGVFLTRFPYIGANGYSLRLVGLEPGINDNAYRRDIVVHGAWYSNPEVIRQYGQLGRSWGCPSVSPATAQPLIDTIKDNTLVVMYYPDNNWLKKSVFLAAN